MKKARKSGHAQSQPVMSNSRYVGRTKMIPDFETMDKLKKLSPNEHWFEVESMHVLKALNCLLLNDRGQS